MFFSSKRTGQPEWLIAFLGNPGAKYEKTRHNAGFMAADALASAKGLKFHTLKFKAMTDICDIGGKKAFVIKPQTFMNLSGDSVQPAAAFYKIPPERIIIVCDDTAIPAGKLRLRRQGSAGGHNGLKSIISSLGTDAFLRIKIGVGSPENPEYDMIDWVIGKITDKESKEMDAAAKRAVDALEAIIELGIDTAMNKFN